MPNPRIDLVLSITITQCPRQECACPSMSSLFCHGNPLGAPSPSATPASENVHTLRGHPTRYVHSLEPAITYGDLLRSLKWNQGGAGSALSGRDRLSLRQSGAFAPLCRKLNLSFRLRQMRRYLDSALNHRRFEISDTCYAPCSACARAGARLPQAVS